MSYCRWSSDNFNCDLYIYGSVDGIEIYVAAKKKPTPDAPSGCDLVPIGLPYDGQHFREPDAAAAFARVVALKAMGYRVTDRAVAELREEAKEALKP